MTLEDKDVLESFRGLDRCECCKNRGALVGHHFWFRKGCGGGSRIDHPFNLIALCNDCHTIVHSSSGTGTPYSRMRFLEIVSQRENVSERTITEFLTWLSRTDRSRAVGPQVRVM